MKKMLLSLAALAAGVGFASVHVDESKLWQERIDAASANGGGVVEIPAGVHWVPKGLVLKDNVTLRVVRNATLLGSTNGFDYIVGALVSAHGAKNIAIEGDGTLDAQGDKWERRVFDANGRHVGWRNPDRAFNVCYLKECRNVRIDGVLMTNPASWTCFLNDCDGVVVRRLRIWSHGNTSNDGLDIASRNVLVEDCDIDSEDDSLVLKTILPSHLVENVEVRNCRLSSNSGICKFGTETCGTMRNVRIHDCEMSVRTPIKFRGAHNWFPGQKNKPEETTFCAIDAIELSVMDGGNLEDVEIRNIKMGFGILAPIVVRHGDRKPRKNPGRPSLRNILLENIEMTLPAQGRIPCQITGVPGFRPQDITLRNVKLIMRGGVRASSVKPNVPERRGGYPGPCVFGSDQFLPAWGFYVRHADGIRFENVTLQLDDSTPGPRDGRPAVYIDDADVKFSGCDIQKNPNDPGIPQIRRVNCGNDTEILVFFDTEDFTEPRAADGIGELAKIMEEEGVSAHFAVVGKMAEALKEWNRGDILQAIMRHEIATHSRFHSVHPTMTQIADENTYEEAYRILRSQEQEQLAILGKTFPGKRVLAFVPPGDNEPYAGQYALRDLGVKFCCGASYADPLGTDMWYNGLFQIPYVLNFEECRPERGSVNVEAIADRLAKCRRAIIFCHPQRVYVDTCWDVVNFKGRNHPVGKPYRPGKWWPKENKQRYLDNIRSVIRRLKGDGRFRFVTISELADRFPERERMTLTDMVGVYADLKKVFGPVDRAGWCLADVYRGAVRFLRGENRYTPKNDEFGFRERPVGVAAPVIVTAADMREAAKMLPTSGFIPASVEVGGVRIGPRDFLMAALEVLATSADTVRIVPVDDQLGSFSRLPRLEKKRYGGPNGWPVYPTEMRGDFVSDMARLQLWTLRK